MTENSQNNFLKQKLSGEIMLTNFKTYNNQGVELYVLQWTYKSME